jgi:hypothetical protein
VKLTTKTAVTIELNGGEATELAVFLYGIEKSEGKLPPIPGQLLHRLQSIPDDGEEVYGQ